MAEPDLGDLLLLALDFTVLTLGARAHRVYLSDLPAGRKVAEILVTVVIAAGISSVSVQMQAIIARLSTVGTITIEQAAVQMGINSVALIWERSALVLVLIFLSGWFRSDVRRGAVTHDVEQPVPPTALSEETVTTILTKLARLDAIEEAMTSLALPPPSLAGAGAALLEHPETPGAPAGTDGETLGEPSLERQVAALLAVKPDLSSRKVAEILERPPSTVYRHILRLKQREEQSA